MRKLYTFFILMCLSIVLVGCTEDQNLPRLTTPSNIVVTDGVITFLAVDGADGYVININQKNVTIEEPRYVILESGTYTFQIKAFGAGYRDSLFSTPMTVTVSVLPQLDKPTNIELSFGVLTFDEVEGATSYVIKIDDEEYTITEPIYYFTEAGSYMVSIKAVGAGYRTSEYTTPVQINVLYPYVETKLQFNYSVFSDFDLDVIVNDHATLNNVSVKRVTIQLGLPFYIDVDEELFEVTEHKVTFKASFFDELEAQKEAYHFLVETNLGKYEVDIVINQSKSPYVYTASKMSASLINDAIFKFETFDATFSSISAPSEVPIEEDEYSYEDGVLTISKTYISKTFNENPEREDIVFTYVFEKNGVLYVAFLSITR